jgi:predicted MFS family arabinose efflux permease
LPRANEATNLYISDFMTQVKGISGSQASLILLVCWGIGFFYVLGGPMGGGGVAGRS